MSNAMRLNPTRWLHIGALQLAALLASGCVITAPRAQSEAPVRAEPSSQVVDPPGRAGKIGLLAGQVTLTDNRSGDSEAATLNWPITGGQRLATGRGSRAEVRIGSTTLRLDADTFVDFNRIDDQIIQFAVARGSVAVRVRNRDLLREIDVLTPRERIGFDDAGRYRIDVDRSPGLTAVSVFVGTARIASGANSFSVASGQRTEVSSQPALSLRTMAASTDVFDDWTLARDQRDDAVRSAQYVSRETTGVEALDEYGRWRAVPDYGTVWFPTAVVSGWAPYRYGRWAYVAPWGWTWIDDAPWGFAPFHYGRWVTVGGVWGWAPGVYVARPIYAPALVAWYGVPGVTVGVSFGGPVGWFPLGWGEPYIPPYRYSPRYIRSINVQHVTNINYTNPVPSAPPRYVHQQPGASTWAPNDAVIRQRPIQRAQVAAPPEAVRLPAASTPSLAVPGDFNRRRIVPAGENMPVDVARPQPRIAVEPAPREAARPAAPDQPGDDLRRGRAPVITDSAAPGTARPDVPTPRTGEPARRGMIEAPPVATPRSEPMPVPTAPPPVVRVAPPAVGLDAEVRGRPRGIDVDRGQPMPGQAPVPRMIAPGASPAPPIAPATPSPHSVQRAPAPDMRAPTPEMRAPAIEMREPPRGASIEAPTAPPARRAEPAADRPVEPRNEGRPRGGGVREP